MSMFKLFAIQNTSFYRFFSHTFFCISIIQQQSRLKFQNARKGIWKMVCQNKIVRKQSSKSILPKIISKILIMIHTSVVHIIQCSFQHKVNFSGKKGDHAICRFHFYSISPYSQVNHVALIYITLSNCLVLRLIIAVIIPSFIHLELLNSQSQYIYYSHALGPVYPIAS